MIPAPRSPTLSGAGLRALRRVVLPVVCTVIVLAGGVTSSARADGDPASDVLVSQPLFLPADAQVSSSEAAHLLTLLHAAERAGFPIQVAVIPAAYDLGSVTSLWHRPRVYARFLGIELSLIRRQPLLVVMPDGLGFAWPGHATNPAYRVLSRISIGPGGAGLLDASQSAVRALAAANGHELPATLGPAPRAPRAGASVHAGHDDGAALIVVGASALLALIAAAGAALVRRRRRHARPVEAEVPAPRDRTGLPGGLRRAAPGLATLFCLGAGIPIVVLILARHGPTARGSPTSAAATPYTWGAGQRRAPGFRLTGENGRPISLAAYRGRPVIVTFVDPLCRNLCPLAAHVLNQVDRELPAARRPSIIAVSVDVYADSHADLAQDFKRWDLVPQWHWAIGRPQQLAAVWRRYDVGVSVATKRIAGITVHFVTHDEVAFIVDANGYVRALYGWPYEPQNLEAELRRIAGV